MRGLGVSMLVMTLACGDAADGRPDETAKAEAKAEEARGKAKAEEAKPEEAKPEEAKPNGSEAAEDVAEPEPPEISPTRAVVLHDGALLRLAPSGKTELLAKTPGTTECDVDDDHRVVWLVSDTAVAAYDPEDGEVHPVAEGFRPPDEGYADFAWQVQRDSGSAHPRVSAGALDGLNDCTGLAVFVDAKPRVGGAIIAEGDREWYCFASDDDVGKDRSEQTLNADEAKIKAGYDEARLVGEAFLIALDRRHAAKGMRSRPRPEAPPAPTPKVDRSQCEAAEEDCGTATYVGGGRLWEVVTSNSRGDFYHEETHLFDAKSGDWWDPAIDMYARTPAGESGVIASPDGTWGMFGRQLYDFTEMEKTGTFQGTVCGWE